MLSRFKKVMASGGLLLCLGLRVQAQESDKGPQAPEERSDRVFRLGEVLIVAPSEERDLLSAPTLESASLDIATSTVDEEMIQKLDATSWVEALDLAPGVFTEERGRKEKHLSSFRGQIYPYPDYSLNGVWQRSFWEVPSYLPSAAIGEIEVLRSGGAIMVGPNSGLVGAINVVPRRFDESTTLLDFQGGSYGTLRGSVVRGDRFDEADYALGGSVYSTEGPDGEHAAESFSSLFGTGGWDLSDRVHLELTAFGLTGNREFRVIQEPGSKAFQNRREEFSPYTSGGGILRTLWQHDDQSSTEFDLGYIHRLAEYFREETGRKDVENMERDWEYNAGVIHARELTDENTLRLGFQYNHWVAPDGKRFFYGNAMDVETLSGVIMDEHQWDRWTVDGGVRLTQSWYRDYTDGTFNIAGDRLFSRTIQNEWGDPALTGTCGAKFELTSCSTLYGHAAVGGLEAPPGGVGEDSESIGNETRFLLDGGVRLEDAELGELSAGFFTTFRQDAILLTDTKMTDAGDAFNTYTNDDVAQYGLEMECRSVTFRDTFSVFGSATIMNSQRYEDGEWSSYREIPNVIVGAGVSAEVGRFDANLFGKYVSQFENRRFAQDGKYHDLGHFVDLNLTTGVSLGKEKNTRIYASFENILDDEYSTVVGYPDYGFQAFLGIHQKI